QPAIALPTQMIEEASANGTFTDIENQTKWNEFQIKWSKFQEEKIILQSKLTIARDELEKERKKCFNHYNQKKIKLITLIENLEEQDLTSWSRIIPIYLKLNRENLKKLELEYDDKLISKNNELTFFGIELSSARKKSRGS